MKWQEITVTTNEESVEAVANIFYEVGAAGVVIEDPNVIARYLEENKWDAYELPPELINAEHVIIKGYLPFDARLPVRLENLQARAQSLVDFFPNHYAHIELNEISETDWANAWKAYYKPERIGDCIVVVPSWEDYNQQEGDVVIYLDPGLAFGTGQHPTTSMCVRLLERYMPEKAMVYDVGTGSGILSIAAAKLGASKVVAVDMDSRAVKIARENVALNNVAHIIQVQEGDLLKGMEEPGHLVVANIIADVILELIPQLDTTLLAEGYLIASGIIQERSNEIIQLLSEAGFRIKEVLQSGDWVALVAQKG